MNALLAAIILTGLSANDPVPGTYLQINFAQGDAAGSGSPIEVLLVGNRTTAGAATLDTQVYGPEGLVQLQTDDDAIALFGVGSELHRMFKAFTRLNKQVTVRAIAVTESVGSKATATCDIATTAAANGNIRVYAYDEFVDVAITSGDTVATIGANAVIAVNNMAHWGFVASFDTATLTFTAKQKGLRGNQIRTQLVISGTGVATTLSALTTDTAFSGGTTSDSNTTALGTIANARYYYIVSAAGDASQLGAAVTQVNLQAAPTTGIRQRVIAASVASLGSATTIATGRNSARCEIVWSEKSPYPEAELAADHAAKITFFETKPNPRTNWCSFGADDITQPYQVVPAPRLASAWPSRTSIKSALNNGLSPIGVYANGTTYLVNGITTRSTNGGVNDYRIRPRHKVTICDFFGDDLVAKINLQLGGKRIGDDPVQGQRPPGPEVVTPILFKGLAFSVIAEYDANNLLQNVQAIKDGSVFQRETNPRTRMTCRIPIDPVENAEQFGVVLNQV